MEPVHLVVGLKPTKHQFETLNEIFEGPNVLRHLMQVYPAVIETEDDAEAFLDRHWKRLSQHMFSRGSGRNPHSVKKLILDWATHGPCQLGIQFPGGCSLSPDNEILLPLSGLGPIPAVDPGRVENFKASRRHDAQFILEQEDDNFTITIAFNARLAPVAPKSKPQPKPKPHVSGDGTVQPPRRPGKIARRRQILPAKDFIGLLSARVAGKLQWEIQVAKQFTKTRFGDLSGYGVNGGLPSLGKRR